VRHHDSYWLRPMLVSITKVGSHVVAQSYTRQGKPLGRPVAGDVVTIVEGLRLAFGVCMPEMMRSSPGPEVAPT
jgi:hypothetical protein